ncbi:MAG: glycosyltransferase family 39 protein [Chloroflexi bacterium]|nr:glycosyltransferase family 39 protein [Chloroflexota bacterium]
MSDVGSIGDPAPRVRPRAVLLDAMAALERRLPLARVDVEVVALVMLAIVVRLPYLWDAPRFTDETAEAEIGLGIARGAIHPLTNRDPYIGALWNYLLAVGFLASGPSLLTPRAIVAAVGVLTVLPTYLLGRSLGGRAVGLLAALFLALSPAHILVNSHIAWSNCITPFFTTLGLWLAHHAVRRDRPRVLPWSGVVLGLAAQTHPTGALILPGVVLAVATARPGWLRGPWPYLSIVAVGVGSANLLLANVQDDLVGLTHGMAVQASYTGGETLTLDVYRDRLGALIYLVSDSMSGALVETGLLVGPVANPLGLALLVAAGTGVELLIRRRDWLLFFVIASFVLLLPAINGRYEASVPKARYAAPLLPLCSSAIGVMLVWTDGRLGRLAATRERAVGLLARGLLVLGVTGMVVTPLGGVVTYYQRAEQLEQTNRRFFEIVAGLQHAVRPGGYFYTDRALSRQYTLGGGRLTEHVRFAAAVYGWQRLPIQITPTPEQTPPRIEGPIVIESSRIGLLNQTYRITRLAAQLPRAAPIQIVHVEGFAAGR